MKHCHIKQEREGKKKSHKTRGWKLEGKKNIERTIRMEKKKIQVSLDKKRESNRLRRRKRKVERRDEREKVFHLFSGRGITYLVPC